jgi:hypothetical protein
MTRNLAVIMLIVNTALVAFVAMTACPIRGLRVSAHHAERSLGVSFTGIAKRVVAATR